MKSHLGNMANSEMPIISRRSEIQGAYEEMRTRGLSHNLAEMFALRMAPTLVTDSTFLAGHCNGNQFEKTPGVGDRYRKEAEAAGVDVTGKVYLSQLAEYPGDPRAWVSGRGDVRRVCEERGWGCAGDVSVKKPTDMAPEPSVRLADDIVESLAADMVESSGGEVGVAEAKQKVIEKHAPKYKE
jgi:hypothetical protein